ncbi:MAG: glycosyltransferase [Pseudomonadota bacterium]
MKILQFGRFHDQNHGGIERHVAILAAGLKAYGTVDNVVANNRWQTEVEAAAPVRTYKIRSLGTLAGVAVAPTFPLFVKRLWERERYDIAHLHFPDPLSHFAAELLPREVKRVVTWHSDIVRQRRLFALYRPLLDGFLERVDAVIAATPKHFEMSRQLDAIRGSPKCRVIAYGIDLAPFAASDELMRRAAKLRASLSSPKSVVFAVGRHVYYKGFEYLIRAMSGLDAVLVLGGSGPLLDTHRRLAAAAGVAHKVIFPGRIEERDLAAYYHAADVFCLPSCEPSEAFGIVQLEAMACAKPIVNCELGNGVNFVAPHDVCALSVPPRDPTALARALNGLLQDTGRRNALGGAGLDRVNRMFSARRMVDEHLALYRELLDAHSQGMSEP